MPYREKIAWLSLLAIGVPYCFYFASVLLQTPPPGPLPDFPRLIVFGVTALTHGSALGLGRLILWLTNRADAAIDLDERDRDFERRSLAAAYGVLMTGMLVVAAFSPYAKPGWEIVNGAVFFVVLAEITHYGVIVFNYRRQS